MKMKNSISVTGHEQTAASLAVLVGHVVPSPRKKKTHLFIPSKLAHVEQGWMEQCLSLKDIQESNAVLLSCDKVLLEQT